MIPKKRGYIVQDAGTGAILNDYDDKFAIDNGPEPVPDSLKSAEEIRDLRNLSKDTWDKYDWEEKICSQVNVPCKSILI